MTATTGVVSAAPVATLRTVGVTCTARSLEDVYAATVGGVRLTEPSVDLAVALALASSVADLSIPQGVIVVGEVGLAGEVRNVAGVPRRIAEAERMGFRQAIVPAGSASGAGSDSAMKVIEVEDVREALKAAFTGLSG